MADPAANADDIMNGDLLTDIIESAVARHGADRWHIGNDRFWCRVTSTAGKARLQGWKLHVSATPLAAPLVLANCAEVLLRRGCSFKFAPNLIRVVELLGRQCERGTGGKFLTAYPDCTAEELRALAAELHRVTLGLPGPGILSDRAYQPGSLVHYRFGAFSGMRTLTNEGAYEAMLVAPDGDLVPDPRPAWFAPPDWAPRDPFASVQPAQQPKSSANAKPVLLNGRYLVRKVIRHAFTGGTFRATDQDTGTEVIVKQARAHAGAAIDGADMRAMRRHEADMLRLFHDSGISPRFVELFEQQGDLFLVEEAIVGRTLRSWVMENQEVGTAGTADTPQLPADAVDKIAAQLIDAVELVHDQGFVMRDLNPNNIMIMDDGELRLIDLELLARPGDMVVRGHTEGYAAREQVLAPVLGPATPATADLYSLGATLFYLATGADPILAPDESGGRRRADRLRRWLALHSSTNPAARQLAPIIVDLLQDDPAARPTLRQVRSRLSRPQPEIRDTPPESALDTWIADAIGYLLAARDMDNPERLWEATDFGQTTDPLNVQHGVAGVLGVLARSCETVRDPALRTAVSEVAQWMVRVLPREPRILPGLYFGRSGTAWALMDAGRLLGDESLIDQACDLARRLPESWPNPDVCHGIAGTGLTQLHMWECTGQEWFLDRARLIADRLAQVVERSSGQLMWQIPGDFKSVLAGIRHFGFAHGVAGIGAFMLAAGRATGDEGYLSLAAEAAQTLVAVAQEHDGAAYWPTGPGDTDRRINWCNGSSGVGTFLLAMWLHNGDERLADLAAKAAIAVRRSRWHANNAQCHGLAGDGEFLLDLAHATGEQRYQGWAEEFAACAYARDVRRHGRIVVANETLTAVTAEFGVGLSGMLASLLRLKHGGPRMWLPRSFPHGEGR